MIAPLVRLALLAWCTLHGSFLFGRGFVDWSVLCACYRKPRMACGLFLQPFSTALNSSFVHHAFRCFFLFLFSY